MKPNMKQNMKQTIVTLLAALACTCAATASASVITFDDLPGDGNTPIYNGYAGFNWDNFGTVASDVGAGIGFAVGTVSGPNAAFNWSGQASTISRADGGTFPFTGAWFASALVDQEISFEGSLQGQVVHATEAFTIETGVPRWIELDWTDIDALTIYNSSPTQWTMDDVALPEPGSLALFGGALAGLLGARRRCRRTR